MLSALQALLMRWGEGGELQHPGGERSGSVDGWGHHVSLDGTQLVQLSALTPLPFPPVFPMSFQSQLDLGSSEAQHGGFGSLLTLTVLTQVELSLCSQQDVMSSLCSGENLPADYSYNLVVVAVFGSIQNI